MIAHHLNMIVNSFVFCKTIHLNNNSKDVVYEL